MSQEISPFSFVPLITHRVYSKLGFPHSSKRNIRTFVFFDGQKFCFSQILLLPVFKVILQVPHSPSTIQITFTFRSWNSGCTKTTGSSQAESRFECMGRVRIETKEK